MTRSPVFDFVALRDTFDQVARQAFGDPSQTLWARSGNGATPAQPMPLDVYATEEQAVITAAIPGMRPEALEVTVHQDTVSLSGTIGHVSETEDAKGATWYVHELGSGAYRRSVSLPFPIDADRVEASFDCGVVRIVAPKAKGAKPRKIAISGSPAQPEAIASGNAATQAN